MGCCRCEGVREESNRARTEDERMSYTHNHTYSETYTYTHTY